MSLSGAPDLVSPTDITSKPLDNQTRERSHPPENASPGGENGLMLHVVGCERQRHPQVVLGQLRVGFKQIRKRAAYAQLAQDQLNSYARTFDARLAHHDGRIGGDASVCHEPSAFIEVAVTAE
jgi:hypothetical protein